MIHRLTKLLTSRIAKRLAIVAGFALLMLVLARNSITRHLGIQVASWVLATEVQIDDVSIGWSTVAVQGIRVFEPAMDNAVQVSVGEVRVVASPWQGIRHGIWIDLVSVDAPVMQVRFDQSGNLVSKFPSGGESESTAPMGKIPIARLLVHDAALLVHQDGRDSFRVEGVSVKAKFDESIAANLSVPDFLGSPISFDVRLDADSLAGVSRLSIADLNIDSAQLAMLPLVPAELAVEPLSAQIQIDLLGNHPANDLDIRSHGLKLNVSVDDVHSRRFDTLCRHFQLAVTQAGGRLSVAAHADPIGGVLEVLANADLNAIHPTGEVTLNLRDVPVHGITRHIPSAKDLKSRLGAAARLAWKWGPDGIQFDGTADGQVRDTSFQGIQIPDVTANLAANSVLDPRDLTKISGQVRGDVHTSVIELDRIARQLGLPDAIGQLVASGRFQIPLGTAAEPETYVAAGSVATAGVGIAGLRLNDATVAVALSEGVAKLTSGELHVIDGANLTVAKLQTDVSASLIGDRPIEASAEAFLELTDAVRKQLGLEGVHPTGRFKFGAVASSTLDTATKPTGWKVGTRLLSTDVSIAGERVSDVDLSTRLEDGQIRMTPLLVSWRGSTCKIQTVGSVADRIELRGDMNIDQVRLGDVGNLLSRFSGSRFPARGLATVRGAFEVGTDIGGQSLALLASGKASLTEASYAGGRIGDAELNWHADLDGLSVGTQSDDFLGGQFDATALMTNLDWTQTTVAGQFSGIELPKLVALTGQPIPSTGSLEGGFRVTSIASIETLSGDAWARSRQASLRQLPIEVSAAHISISAGDLGIGSEGNVAGGRFSAAIEGGLGSLIKHFSTAEHPLSKIPLTVQAKLSSLPVDRLVRAAGLGRELRLLNATISGDVTREQSAWDGRHLCTVTGSVEDVRWGHGQLSNRISTNFVVHPTRVELTEVSGRFADGRLSGTADVDFSSVPQGLFDLSASHVNLRRATTAVGVKGISGTGTVRLRGRIAPTLTGRADVSAEHMVAGGISVRRASFPVHWSFSQASQTARWQCRAGTVSTGGGNVRIASDGSYANSLSMNTSVQVEKVDLSKLMQGGSPASGMVNGTVNLRAKNARTPKQLVGNFDFQMENIKALEIPILNQLPTMMTLSPPVPGRDQDGGTVHGRIGNGLVHIDEMALHQSNVQVILTGTATTEGRLNMDVVASTKSDSPTDGLVSLMNSPLMMAAPAPVALLVRANEMLKDRVVNVHVGGTANHPTLRLQPGKQLSQSAVQFFLTTGLGVSADRLSDVQSKTQRR
ncbi:Dicarboxylate transport [Rubripirellula lacrimiformis]|uniref:Dicarboxylate transport n=1 Tax=Rubripirellula lacrimiformis TaxID=1930273 RepID=A0A517NCE5_9BACT|nr:AsmA-like C-terminal region-containing protein [Rubripirellula lacrimiformis]QDT04812.1 Dicarboxylate transport [Rubripirellula lacrimiformis]